MVETGFWAELGELKLHSLGLEEGPLPLTAHYAPCNHAELPGLVTLSSRALGRAVVNAAPAPTASAAPTASQLPAGTYLLPGQAYVLNTVEQLKTFDRKAAVQKVRWRGG